MDSTNPATEKKKRNLKPFLILLVLVLIAGGFLAARRFDRGDAKKQEEALERALTVDALPAKEDFNVQVSPDDLSITEGLDPDWFNILLLGTDERRGILNEGRSDAVMVLSVNTKSGEIKLTTLVRDMLVPIPGASSNDKIAHANKYGGPLLVVKTVNEILGLNIRHYVSIDFKGFINAVNILGGVELKLDDSIIYQFKLEKGQETYRLTGGQALRFVRIRRIDNNFGRNERQRQFLTAMLDQVRRQDSGLVMEALTESLKAMNTNLSVSDLMMLTQKVLGGKLEPSLLGLPAYGQFTTGRASNGNNGVIAKMDKLAANFHNFVYKGDVSGIPKAPD